MTNKKFKILIFAIVLLSIVTLVFLASFTQSNNPNRALTLNTKEFNITEIQKNNNDNSCWTVINGTVYDATKVLANNQDIKQILLNACGKDGSDTYVIKKYSQQNLNRNDIQKLYNQLKEFRLGIIAPTIAE